MSAPPSNSERLPAQARAWWPVHPLLLAACPVLSLFFASLGEVFLSDVWLPLGVALLGTGVVLAIARLATGSWERAALMASYVVVLFFGFQFAYRAIFIIAGLTGLPLIPFKGYLAIWALVLCAGIALLVRWPRSTQRATRWVNVFAAVLLVIVLVAAIRPGYRLAQARLQARADEPLALRVSDDSPDIYYLIFDRYASPPTLERDFNYDNRSFYEQLRQRGFYCAEQSHANYPRTKISMASALNLRLLDNAVYDDHVSLLYHHVVGASLRKAGYTNYHLGNWYGPLRFNGDAAYNWPASKYPSYFVQELCQTTPLTPLLQWASGEHVTFFEQPQSAALIEAKFEKLKEISRKDERKFVYAHFLLPHPPFVFNADGTHTTPSQVNSRTYEQSYVQQLIYANGRILELVDAIAANSRRPPIIIIQADEGPILTASDAHKTRVQKMQKRTGIISAFRLPGQDATKLITPDITPVNTFRVVFSTYFGADLPPLANRVFFWDPADRAGVPDEASFVRAVDITDELSREVPPVTAAVHEPAAGP